jgi:hypothetical protein
MPQLLHVVSPLSRQCTQISTYCISHTKEKWQVSMKDSVLPKHLARFSFSAPPTVKGTSPPPLLTIQVFPPGTKEGDGVDPLFACTVTPWACIPALPVNTRYVPKSLIAAQPPIPEAAGHRAAAQEALSGMSIGSYNLNPTNEVAVYVGTDRWCTFEIAARVSRARGCWVEMLAGKSQLGRGCKEKTWFPRDLKAWRIGAWCEEVVWSIGDVVEWNP